MYVIEEEQFSDLPKKEIKFVFTTSFAKIQVFLFFLFIR
jgi:hypothetical protein